MASTCSSQKRSPGPNRPRRCGDGLEFRCWLGGAAGPKLFRHIAEFGDGWLPMGGAGVGAAMADLRAVAEESGRDPASLTVIPFGTLPDRGKLEHYASLGITETVLRLPSAGRDEVLATLDRFEPFVAG